MKKLLWMLLFVMLICALALTACDTDANLPSDPDIEQSTPPSGNEENETPDNTEADPAPDTDTACLHILGDWITVKQASCAEDGKLVRTCRECAAEEETTVDKSSGPNTSWGINETKSFSFLYSNGYIPITCKALTT